MLEPLSAACCAVRRDREEIVVPVLRDLLAEAGRALDDTGEFTVASRRFHEALGSFNDNQSLRLVLRGLGSLWAAQEGTWRQSLTDALNRAGDHLSLEEWHDVPAAHGRIVDAIERGDPDEVERPAREHLSSWRWEIRPGVQGQVVDAASSKLRARYRAHDQPPGAAIRKGRPEGRRTGRPAGRRLCRMCALERCESAPEALRAGAENGLGERSGTGGARGAARCGRSSASPVGGASEFRFPVASGAKSAPSPDLQRAAIKPSKRQI